mgnify:FL=1
MHVLVQAMVEYDRGDVPRIQHFMKVHDFAVTIAQLEGVDEATLFAQIIKDNTLAELGLGNKCYKKIKVTHLI